MKYDESEVEVLPWPVVPEADDLCSRELYTFLVTHQQVYDFFFFGATLATRMDEQRMIAAKALAKHGNDKDAERLEKAERDPKPTFDRLKKFRRLQSENMCIRIVDNFSTYLSEIVQAAMVKRPEILKSNELVKIEDVLRFSTYKDLIAFLVNKKVNELSYKNMLDFEKFVMDRTGLILTDYEYDKTNLMFGIEIRNIYTHSRGIVTETTMKRREKINHSRTLALGQIFEIDFDELTKMSNSLVNIARGFDEKFCNKFKIRRRRYKAFGGEGES